MLFEISMNYETSYNHGVACKVKSSEHEICMLKAEMFMIGGMIWSL